MKRFSPFLILCFLGGAAIFSSTMAKNPALPLFTRSLGVPEGLVGFVAAASTVVGIVTSLPAGLLSDRLGRRRVILISALVFASAPFLYLAVITPWQLVAVRIYHGLATAILGPVALAAAAEAAEERKGERMATYSSATLIGRLLAPTAGGLLIVGQDFRWVYLGSGVAGVLALAAALVLPRDTRCPAQHSSEPRLWPNLRALLLNRGIAATSLIEATQYFAFGCVEVYLALYAVRVGLIPWQIGSLFTGQVIVMAVTKPPLGRLSDRMGRVPFIIAGLLVSAVGMSAMPSTRSYALLAGLAGLFGLGMASTTASTAALIADLCRGRSYGAALGALSSVMDVGHATGPMLGGVLVGAFGYAVAFGTVGGLMAGAALAFAVVMHGTSYGGEP